VSVQSCTIWTRERLEPEKLSAGFNKAAKLLDLRAFLVFQSTVLANSSEAWERFLAAFPSYAFTGVVKWFLGGDDEACLKGKLTWPIHNPGELPATIEFDFPWGTTKSKKYGFTDASLLVNFLHALCTATCASSLLVEGKKLPPDLNESRFKRFRELTRVAPLTSLDWIFGLRTGDHQYRQLELCGISFAATKEADGFAVYALNEAPLNYEDPADMSILAHVESALGLTEG